MGDLTNPLEPNNNEPSSAPRNAKERLYERLRFVPLWLLDTLIVLLGVAVVVVLIIGFIRGQAV